MSQTKSRNTHSSRQQSPLFIHTLSSHLDGLVFGLQEKTEIDASVCVCVCADQGSGVTDAGRQRQESDSSSGSGALQSTEEQSLTCQVTVQESSSSS